MVNIWQRANVEPKREILETVNLNRTSGDATLCVAKRKPFDVLAKGLVLLDGRGNRTPVELFAQGVRALEPVIQQLILAA